jgi:hypothetical protein
MLDLTWFQARPESFEEGRARHTSGCHPHYARRTAFDWVIRTNGKADDLRKNTALTGAKRRSGRGDYWLQPRGQRAKL